MEAGARPLSRDGPWLFGSPAIVVPPEAEEVEGARTRGFAAPGFPGCALIRASSSGLLSSGRGQPPRGGAARPAGWLGAAPRAPPCEPPGLGGAAAPA